MVLVCTDAAARGLDIPDVSHVVQAEFAASAIDFIHRVSTVLHPSHFSIWNKAVISLLLAVQALQP